MVRNSTNRLTLIYYKESSYKEPVRLNQKNVANLKSLLPFIPLVYHNFYLDLGVEGVTANEEWWRNRKCRRVRRKY